MNPKYVTIISFSLCCSLFFCPGYAAEPTRIAMDGRQGEILRELESFRPPGDSRPGVWMLEVWNSDEGLENLVSFPGAQVNAAGFFKRAEELYPAEKEMLADQGENAKGVDCFLEAATAGYCRFMPDYYPVFVTTESPQPDFQVMRLYLQALLRRGEVAEERGDKALAERCFQAALVCGWHLTNDKSSGLIYITGIIFKYRAARAYANFLVRTGDPGRAELARHYAERVSVIMRAFLWKANTALSEFDGFACLPAVIRILSEDREVFWRKEAVVRLATLRYGIPDANGATIHRNPAAEKIADAALAKAASEDPDQTVRKLAIWVARNIRPQNYDELRHEFGK